MSTVNTNLTEDNIKDLTSKLEEMTEAQLQTFVITKGVEGSLVDLKDKIRDKRIKYHRQESAIDRAMKKIVSIKFGKRNQEYGQERLYSNTTKNTVRVDVKASVDGKHLNIGHIPHIQKILGLAFNGIVKIKISVSVADLRKHKVLNRWFSIQRGCTSVTMEKKTE